MIRSFAGPVVSLAGLSVLLNWKDARANLPLGDTYDNSVLKSISIPGDNALQVVVDPVGLHVAKTKYDGTRQSFSTGCDKFTEVQVVCQENAPLVSCLFQDFRVRKTVKPLFMQMHGVMSQIREEGYHLGRNPHVGKKSHTDARSAG